MPQPPEAQEAALEEAASENDAKTPTPVTSKKIIRRDPDAQHGRYASNDYTGCAIVKITHETLQVGSFCPGCAEAGLKGKLGPLKPGLIIRLESNPLISGTRYEVEKLRCHLCGDQYVASVPEEIAKREKFSPGCRAAIAVGHYYFGLPFHRIERWQALHGIPLPDATQFDQVNKLYNQVKPVHTAMEEIAAEGRLFYYDDTPSIILFHKLAGNTGKSVYTTAIISQVGQNTIQLFYTGPGVAHERFEALLAKREGLEPMLTMTDASRSNIPRHVNLKVWISWVLCFCLVHGRRQFYEIRECFTPHCDFVIDQIAKVYEHEAFCKKEKFTPQERLAYHQTHSSPVMQALWIWLNNQLLYRSAEPNSGLGVAIRYMLRYWRALTRFLHYADAPIDNSWSERLVKIIIRYRNNALFFKTDRGAHIGDGLMSLIQTAIQAKVNPFHYLTTLQKHAESVAQEPHLWLPWNYQATQASLVSTIAA